MRRSTTAISASPIVTVNKILSFLDRKAAAMATTLIETTAIEMALPRFTCAINSAMAVSSRPTAMNDVLRRPRATAAPPAVQEGSARADPQPCTLVGPAGREYKNTGLLTELKQEHETKAALSSSSSPVLSSSPKQYCFDYC